jgi:voltage-gated potassium channel
MVPPDSREKIPAMAQLDLRPSATGMSPGYQVFMLVLCVYSLGILAFQAGDPPPETRSVLDYADFLVCMVFLADFLVSLYRAESKWRYFVTWGWIDLLSSIPAVDVARWGRAARILRVLRVLRGLRATHMMAMVFLKNRGKNTVMAACLAVILLITFCSIAILNFEAGTQGNIQSAEDAVWWAITTITTVGYGDRYPTTTEGRMIAVLLMSAGVGLFGTFSGFLASWFSGEDEGATAKEIAALRGEIAKLSQQLGENAGRSS